VFAQKEHCNSALRASDSNNFFEQTPSTSDRPWELSESRANLERAKGDMKRVMVGEIPVVYVEPQGESRKKLVIFLSGFSGDKEGCLPRLEELAALGFTAVSFDAWQHGERMVVDVAELRARISGNIRRYFWPILAHTAREVPLVIDWALERFDLDDAVGMGGISMGGDISVVAAGIDQRIAVAVPGIATPDWLRPGTFEPVGQADEIAQVCYDELNPLTHLEHYAHCPRIVFQNGAEDGQVPPDGSLRFCEMLRASHYQNCSERIEAVLHEHVAHAYGDAMWENTKQLLAEHL
jgi:dienelactone hydrolase